MNDAAQTDGAYTALIAMATGRSVTFVPRPVNARAWLGDQPAPTIPISWRPHRVIMSCDGKTGVVTGAIRWGETDGYYTTVWQYFASPENPDDGIWRWTLSHGDGLQSARPAPAQITSDVASCEGSPNVAIAAPPVGSRFVQTQSGDQSLSYAWLYRPDGSREITVKTWDGERHNVVLRDVVAAGDSE